MSKNLCPNLSSKEYRQIASVVGSAQAHTFYRENNGYPISQNTDGSPSLLFDDMVKRIGMNRAVKMRVEMNDIRFTSQMIGTSTDTLRVNSDGTVRINPYTLIDIENRAQEDPAIEQFNMRREHIKTAEHVDILLKSIAKALPGFNVITETFHSTKGTINERAYAWVDKNGLHFNTQSLNYDSPIHELSHIWVHALEFMDPDKYTLFMDKVKDSIEKNKKLYNTVKESNPDLNDEQLLFEYASTIAGLHSSDSVISYLNNNNEYVDKAEAKSIYRRFADMISEFYTNIKNLLSGVINEDGISSIDKLDFETATLDDIFEGLTKDVLMGRQVVNMTPLQQQTLLNKYYTDAQEQSAPFTKKISDVTDIINYILDNNDYNYLTNDGLSEDQEKEEAKRIRALLNEGDSNFYIYDFNHLYEFSKKYTEDELLLRIKETIISDRKTFINSFRANLKDAFNLYETNQDPKKKLIDIVKEAFAEGDVDKFPTHIAQQIEHGLQSMGITNSVSEILEYKELESNPKYNHLYNHAIAALNPLVLIHNAETGTPDISLIDIAPGKLGFQNTQLGNEHNLAYNIIGANSEYSMNNSTADARAIVLATMLAGMRKMSAESKTSFRLRKVGSIGFNGFSVDPKMILSIQKLFNNAHKLFNEPNVKDKLMDMDASTHSWLMELIDSKEHWQEEGLMQTWKHKLESYYMMHQLDNDIPLEEVKNLTEGVFGFGHYQFIRSRMKQIEVENEQNDKRLANNDEYKLLAQYMIHYDLKKFNFSEADITDVRKTFMKVTSVHDIGNVAIQELSIVAEASKSRIIDKTNAKKDVFQKLLKDSLRSREKKAGFQSGKSSFEHLFKKSKATFMRDGKDYKANTETEIILFNKIYGSYNLKEAQDAGLTPEDIALADYMFKEMKQSYLDLALHKNTMIKSPVDEADIIKRVNDEYRDGFIPVMSKTINEYWQNWQVKQAATKTLKRSTSLEFLPDGMFDDTKITSVFRKQMRSYSDQMSGMGLAYIVENGEEKIFIKNKDQYDNHTLNLEEVFNMVVHDAHRLIEFENNVLPTFRAVRQWIDIVEKEYSVSQKYTKLFVDEYYDRIVSRTNQDQKTDKLNAVLKNTASAYSFASLGYRPVLWFRSFYFNFQNQMLISIAESAVADNSNFPSGKHMAEAYKLFATDFSKIYQLARKYTIINQSELEVIDSVFTTMTDKNLWRGQIAQLGNYYTDAAARMITMTAFMLKDGTYKAHTFNQETNTLKYDYKLDPRYYKDGKFLDANTEALFNNNLLELINDNLATDKDDMIAAYTFRESNTRFKWYSDKYIIGTMDEYQSMLMGNTTMGRLMTQFRFFMSDKLFNVIGSKRNVSYGTVTSPFENEDGDLMFVNNQITIEGTGASYWRLMTDVVKVVRYKDYTFKQLSEEFAAETPEIKKMRVLGAMKAIFFTAAVAGIAMMGKGLNDRDKNKLSFLYSELMSFRMIMEVFTNVIPLSSIIDSMMSIVTGTGKWTDIIRYIGPANDAVWGMELFGDNKNIRKTINTKVPTEQEKADKREQRRLERAAKIEKDNQ